MCPASRPISSGAIVSTALMTVSGWRTSLADPRPYSPGWSVWILIIVQLPSARVRMHWTLVILVISIIPPVLGVTSVLGVALREAVTAMGGQTVNGPAALQHRPVAHSPARP